MPRIAYQDFDLCLEGIEGGRYRARVLDSPAGQAEAEFEMPFTEEKLENYLLKIGKRHRGVRRVETPEMDAAKQLGRGLFNAVFANEVLGCLRGSLAEANKAGVGLRLRLRFDKAGRLLDLPWEYLWDPALNRFLARSIHTPLVRYLDLPERIRPLEVKPPLHVLVMISSPKGLPPLDTEREWRQLKETLAPLENQGLLALDRLDEATMDELLRRLQRRDYHVFHFIGHGGFDARDDDGFLILEDKDESGWRVSGQTLGALLHDHRALRLAVLNACEGGRSSRTDPFAGTAQSLVQQGIPAVIAMQFEVSDDAAIAFAQAFYRSLAAGLPVDASLGEARKAILAQRNEVEWGTPVLYMRAQDGQVFNLPESALPPAEPAPTPVQPVAATPAAMPAPTPQKPSRPPAPPPSIDNERAKQLSDAYTQALSCYYTEKWDKAVELLAWIVEQQSDYEDAAKKLAAARKQLQLAQLLGEAKRACDGQGWDDAVARLQSVLELEPAHRDAQALLAKAKLQGELAELYGEARRLSGARSWAAVVQVFGRIRSLDRSFPDRDGLLATAEKELAAQQREEQLAGLYRDGLRQMDAGDWLKAANSFSRIQELDPWYRESAALLAKAKLERNQRVQQAAPQEAPQAKPAEPPPPVSELETITQSSPAALWKRYRKPLAVVGAGWTLASLASLISAFSPAGDPYSWRYGLLVPSLVNALCGLILGAALSRSLRLLGARVDVRRCLSLAGAWVGALVGIGWANFAAYRWGFWMQLGRLDTFWGYVNTWTVVCVAGWGAAGWLTGIWLKRLGLLVTTRQVGFIALGWLLAWLVSDLLGTGIALLSGLHRLLEGAVFANALKWAMAGALGGTWTFWQIHRAAQDVGKPTQALGATGAAGQPAMEPTSLTPVWPNPAAVNVWKGTGLTAAIWAGWFALAGAGLAVGHTPFDESYANFSRAPMVNALVCAIAAVLAGVSSGLVFRRQVQPMVRMQWWLLPIPWVVGVMAGLVSVAIAEDAWYETLFSILLGGVMTGVIGGGLLAWLARRAGLPLRFPHWLKIAAGWAVGGGLGALLAGYLLERVYLVRVSTAFWDFGFGGALAGAIGGWVTHRQIRNALCTGTKTPAATPPGTS